MARIDKYDPVDGGFRAPLAGAWTGSADPVGVGLNSSGRVVAGAGVTGILGLLCKPDNAVALSIVDVMTDGELTEFTGAAGTVYTAATSDGTIDATAPGTGHIALGFTVEADRLVVRTGGVQGGTGGEVVGGQANIVALTDNTVGTANNTLEALPNPTDTPASADALRDDLVAVLIPALRNNFADLAAKVNTIISTLDSAGVTL